MSIMKEIVESGQIKRPKGRPRKVLGLLSQRDRELIKERTLALKNEPGTVGRPLGNIEDSTIYRRVFTTYIIARVIAEKEELITAMLTKAKNGDVGAFNALLDRTHGKPSQAVEMSGAGGQPIVFMPLELIQKQALKVVHDINVENTPPLDVATEPVANLMVDKQ